jgi:hypothetical protein
LPALAPALALSCLCAARPAAAAIGCTLNDPLADIARFYPEMTDFLVLDLSFEAQDPGAWAKLAEGLGGGGLDPVYETPDTPFSVYEVARNGERLGWVFGANQRGSYSNIQVHLATDAQRRVKQVYIQRLRNPRWQDFQAEAFLEALAAVPLDDWPKFRNCWTDGDCRAVPVADPSGGAEAADFRNLVRALGKLALVDELLLKVGQSPKPRGGRALAEWIGERYGAGATGEPLLSRDPPDPVTAESWRSRLRELDAPILVAASSGDSLAVPLALLARHPVLNGRIGSRAAVVTWSASSQTAAVFWVAEGDGFAPTNNELFGVRTFTDLRTNSQWDAASGSCVYGARAGERLERVADVRRVSARMLGPDDPHRRWLLPAAGPDRYLERIQVGRSPAADRRQEPEVAALRATSARSAPAGGGGAPPPGPSPHPAPRGGGGR